MKTIKNIKAILRLTPFAIIMLGFSLSFSSCDLLEEEAYNFYDLEEMLKNYRPSAYGCKRSL